MADYVEHALYLTARTACDYATEYAGKELRHLKGGRNCFYPIWDAENNDVGVGIVDQYHYLVYQNRGFATFTMKWAIGRLVPMLLPDGTRIFRYCRGVGQFRSGFKDYWYRDIDGNLVPKRKQRRAWTHPGLGPKNFIEKSIESAVKDNEQYIGLAYYYDTYSKLEDAYDNFK